MKDTLASLNFEFAQKQYVVGDTIIEQAQSEIQSIMNELTIGNNPNKAVEIDSKFATFIPNAQEQP